MIKQIKIVFSLTFICALCGTVLAFANQYTRDAIKEAERKDFLHGLWIVMPEYDNFPDTDVLHIQGNNVYIGKKNDKITGYGLISSSNKGYGGVMDVLIGITSDGKISGVTVLKHTETPGLGDRITKDDFLNLFKGHSDPNVIKVKKDGGVIDQFSGATMSPNAVADAVSKGLEFVKNNVLTGGRK